MEYIKIEPVKELLKAIEIVHGPKAALLFERFVLKAQEDLIKQRENTCGDGI